MIIPPKKNTESDLNLLNTEETCFSTIDKTQKHLKILASKILLMLAGWIWVNSVFFPQKAGSHGFLISSTIKSKLANRFLIKSWHLSSSTINSLFFLVDFWLASMALFVSSPPGGETKQTPSPHSLLPARAGKVQCQRLSQKIYQPVCSSVGHRKICLTYATPIVLWPELTHITSSLHECVSRASPKNQFFCYCRRWKIFTVYQYIV